MGLNSGRGKFWLSIAIVTPLGFATKLYAGPGAAWVGPYGGGVLYEVFWILLIMTGWPNQSAFRVASGVLLVTSVLEVLQLWHPPVLEAVRATFLGRTLLGTTFSAWDFPHYVGGCLVGLGLVRWICRPPGTRTPVRPDRVGESQESGQERPT